MDAENVERVTYPRRKDAGNAKFRDPPPARPPPPAAPGLAVDSSPSAGWDFALI